MSRKASASPEKSGAPALDSPPKSEKESLIERMAKLSAAQNPYGVAINMFGKPQRSLSSTSASPPKEIARPEPEEASPPPSAENSGTVEAESAPESAQDMVNRPSEDAEAAEVPIPDKKEARCGSGSVEREEGGDPGSTGHTISAPSSSSASNLQVVLPPGWERHFEVLCRMV